MHFIHGLYSHCSDMCVEMEIQYRIHVFDNPVKTEKMHPCSLTPGMNPWLGLGLAGES